ncbi:MAG: HU family DNA-binding protein [Actinomycetales bacterium]
MNRSEVARSIALRTGVSGDTATAMLSAFEQVLMEAVSRGEKVSLPGILSVEQVERPARRGRNPQTGEPIDIPAGHGVKVAAGSRLKAAAS